MRKNNKRNKLLSMLLCCVMIVGMLPTNVLAAPNDFTIVGWESKGAEGAIASVKINGQTVPQNGGTLSIPPNITVSIEITFNPGFKIGSGVDGIVLQWGGIQSGYDNIKNSTDHTTIDMPDTNWFNTEDQELYLIIATTKIDYIKETEVTVPPILCGEGYTRGQIGSDWNPVPNISIPANADYAIKYAQWCVPDPNTPGSYISPSAPAVFRGGDEVYIDVGLKALVDDGFVLGLEPTATINGATKVESMYIESSQDSANDTVYYRMILKATVQHIPGEVVRENEIAATCTTDGSYDEVIYCTACSAELSRQKKTEKAFGHDWDKWTVKTPATETAVGEEMRICKNDSSHTETREIPALPHTHSYTQKHDDDSHWNECTCGDIEDKETHRFGKWAVTKETTDTKDGEKKRVCSVCGYYQTAKISVFSVQTGDSSNLLFWIIMLLVSVSGIVGTVIYAKKKATK